MSQHKKTAAERYHDQVAGSFRAQVVCKVCGRTIRSYGVPEAICSSCDVKRTWVPNGSRPTDYGDW